MNTDTALVHLMRKLDEDIESNTNCLIKGGSNIDLSEYKRLCGVIQGLTLATEHLKDLAQRQTADEDNDGN
jgi:hypothetical protein